MDEIVKAEVINVRALTSAYTGPVAELTTRHGDVYHVWIGGDGQPLIQRLDHEYARRVTR